MDAGRRHTERRGYATQSEGEERERVRERREGRTGREGPAEGRGRLERRWRGTVDAVGGEREGRNLFYTILLYNSCLPESY